MADVKHVGRLKSTSERVVVIFRQLVDETGEVVDADRCLVVKLDTLPDMLAEGVRGILYSLNGQEANNLYDYMNKVKVADGRIALTALHQDGRLLAVDVNDVVMIMNSKTEIELRDLNNALAGITEGEAETTETAVVEPVVHAAADAMPPKVEARRLLDEANVLVEKVTALRHKAKQLDPTVDIRKERRA